MIHINTNSLFYRFLDTNPLTDTWNISTNLCPYMRQVLFGILFNFFVASLFTFLMVAPLFTLIIMFIPVELWAPLWSAIAGLGIIEWVFIIGFLIYFSYVRYLSKYQPIHKAVDKVTGLNSVQQATAWVSAKHDKICPPIQFIEDNK